jgi:hypothetical protein
MKTCILLISFLSIIYSCHNNSNNNNKPGENINTNKFDKTKWKIKDNKDYPYRDK